MPNLTLNATDRMTAIEVLKRNNYAADARRVVETLRQTNEILLDVPVYEANNAIVHKTLRRTSLPTAEVRKLNQGVGRGSSTTETVEDRMVELGVWSEVDKKIVNRQADKAGKAEILMSENAAFIEGMGQQQAEMMVYADMGTDPDVFDGLAARRSKLGDNCINAGGSGSNLTSIYLAKVGRNGLHYIFPKGASGIGVKREDKGLQIVKDRDGNDFEAYKSYYSCEFGLSLGNEKNLKRIANIDVNSIKGEDLIKLILSQYKKLAVGDGSVVLYANSDVLNLIDLSLLDRGNMNYTTVDPWGKPIQTIRDIRLRQVDAILGTESALV